MNELYLGAPPQGKRAMTSAKDGLGAADGGDVQQQAQVTGDAEATRMGQPLSIHEEEIRDDLHLLQGSQESGRLAEGEEPRDVRHLWSLRVNAHFGDLQFGIREHHGGARHPALGVGRRQVNAGDPAG